MGTTVHYSWSSAPMNHPNPTQATIGAVLHSPARYDFFVGLMMLGRERTFREAIIRLSRIGPGESVLDVGCGTGSLAIAAKRHVGSSGKVYGIDASSEMLARATRKARKAGVDVVLTSGIAQDLPFAGAQFDAVLSTVMLHHLPRQAREQCAREMRRVLKLGGRGLVVEFGSAVRERRSFLGHVHRHGHVKIDEVISILTAAGLKIVDSGAVGIKDLHFVLATSPCPT